MKYELVMIQNHKHKKNGPDPPLYDFFHFEEMFFTCFISSPPPPQYTCI